MIDILKKRRQEGEEGFTLIELMVVVLIIAILLAIAIPTFLGARKRAQDRSAQSSLRNALTAAKTMYTDASSYAGADESATGLKTVEPSVAYVAAATASSDPKTVSVNASTNSWSAAAWSASGNCFFIKETTTGPTAFGTSAVAADCTGTKADTAATVDKW